MTAADVPGAARTGTIGTVIQTIQLAPPHGRVRARRAAARDDQRWLLRRFVEPPNYNDAWEMLAERGCVLLSGQSGSGRGATARMLLFRLPGPYVPIREVPDRPDSPDDRVLDADTIERGDRLLLDLSDTEESQFRSLLPRLWPYRAEVRERGAHLVVVLRSRWEHNLPADLAALGVEIGRPEGLLVLRRHLRAERIEYTSAPLAESDMSYALSAPMRLIAAGARMIRANRDRKPDGTFEEWLRSAYQAISDRDSDVAEQLRGLPDARQRALLLSAAMLDGAPAEAVHRAATNLLAATHFPPDDRPPLARPSLAEQLAAIKTHTDAEHRVHFDSLGTRQAVRTHFWTNFPDLRATFRDWVGDTATLDELTDADRIKLIDRFAWQAFRLGRPGDLSILTARWADANQLALAETVMERGLASGRYGGACRRQIYDWSVDRSISPGLAALVVRACVDVLAVTHPDQALVRLHHLVRRQGGPAWPALLDLVESDRMQWRRLLARVTRAEARPWAADLDLFLVLVQPDRVRPLLGTPEVREQLIAGWRAVLSVRPERVWADAVRRWLSAGLDTAPLVTAGDADSGVLSRLYAVARDWARQPGPDRDARRRAVAGLAEQIDSAQGVVL